MASLNVPPEQLEAAVSAHVRDDASVVLEVPFEAVPDLVAQRRVLVRRGRCAMPATWLDRLLTRVFARHLRRQLAVTSKLWAYADDRIHAVGQLALACFQTLPKSVPQTFIPQQLTEADIDRVRRTRQWEKKKGGREKKRAVRRKNRRSREKMGV